MSSFIPNENLKILEPSCGEGAFLDILVNKNIDANDINSFFIDKCKKKFPNITFYNEDFINFDKKKKYDIIIGNPPYIRIQNLEKKFIEQIKLEYPILTGNLDIYIYFILKCLDMLSKNGKLIFIIPNSFLFNNCCKKILNNLMKKGVLEYIIDFKDKKIFPNISVYTCILILNKQNCNKRNFYYYSNDINHEYKKINYNINNINNSLLKYINIKNGIATLCDNVFIIDTNNISFIDEFFIHLTKNNKKYKIEKNIVKDILKVSKNKMYKIIFPYIYNNGKYTIIENIDDFPECKKYLLDYKNILLNRDKGKKKYEKWYAFGRKQGLIYNNEKRLFISNLVLNLNCIENDAPLFYSGLLLEVKNEYKNIINLKQILIKNQDKILQNANIKSGGWFSLTKQCFNINID